MVKPTHYSMQYLLQQVLLSFSDIATITKQTIQNFFENNSLKD